MPTLSNVVPPRTPGSRKEVVVEYTGPVSYTTGGEAYTPADFGLEEIDYIVITDALSEPGTPAQLHNDRTAETFVIFDYALGTEVANASDQSSEMWILRVVGF